MNEELIPYLGGLVSIISSFFGAFASGGSVLILLSSLFILTPYPYLSLLATAKVAGMAMTFVSSSVHYRKTKVNRAMISVMTVTGFIGMAGATWLIQIYPNEAFFEKMIGVMLLVFAIYLLTSKTKGLDASGRTSFTKRELCEVAGVMVLIGFVNGFSGGMGFILNAYLILRLKMSFIEATAYTMISGFLVVASQAIYLANVVEINRGLLAMVVLGSLLGGYFGTQLQYLKGNRTVKWVVTGMMFILGTAAFVQ
ncbi:MAG: sulfite exporter TauE/SafE family protein [Patescibacteria group bacterium]